MLGVNENQLEDYEKQLDESQIKYATFQEPDIGNVKTAIAIQPSAPSKMFRDLKLI